MALSKRELVSHKCVRCQESVIAERQDTMLELAKHLFDNHKDSAWGKVGEYKTQFPNGSFILEQENK